MIIIIVGNITMGRRIVDNRTCPHRNQKSYCILCNPTDFCEHKSLLSRCRFCYFKAWCRHKGRRKDCVHCRDTICPHGMNKKRCQICKGSNPNMEIPGQMPQEQPVQLVQPVQPVLQAPPIQPVQQAILSQGVTFGQSNFCMACPAHVQVFGSFNGTQNIQPIVLTLMDSVMCKIQSGSIIRLDDGTIVLFQYDGYCYQTNSLPHPPFVQTIQSASLRNSLEKDDDLESFLGLLP